MTPAADRYSWNPCQPTFSKSGDVGVLRGLGALVAGLLIGVFGLLKGVIVGVLRLLRRLL
jgi:hypothetical protein